MKKTCMKILLCALSGALLLPCCGPAASENTAPESTPPAQIEAASAQDEKASSTQSIAEDPIVPQEGEPMTGTAFNTQFFNPIKDDPMLGDPWIIQRGGMYYYTQSGGDHIVIRSARTITGISAGASKEIWHINSQPGLTQVWAPEIHFYDGRWYCYFTARSDGKDELRRIYVLQCDTEDPMQEWNFIGRMDLPEDQWAIDATFFEQDGRLFLLWSGWKDMTEGPGVWRQNIYICELQDPVTVMPGTQRVCLSTPEYSWELVGCPQNEGPEILRSPNGKIFCIYSASFSKSDSYCLGQLELTGDPMDADAWVKSTQPVFQSEPANRVYSPGHCSFTQSPDGSEYWIVYHAAKDSRAGWDRSARAQQFTFDESGYPVFGTPLSTNEVIELPAGEQVQRMLYEAEHAELTGAEMVEQEGASGGTIVKLVDDPASVTFRIEVPAAGNYAVYVRYTNTLPMKSEASLRINEGREIPAVFQRCAMSGAASSDIGLTVFRVDLQAGANSLVFSGSRIVGLDCIILELMG